MLRNTRFRRLFEQELASPAIQSLKRDLILLKREEERREREVRSVLMSSYKHFRDYYPFFPIFLKRRQIFRHIGQGQYSSHGRGR